MKFPATSDELKNNGWEYDNDSTCRGCQAPIEWWISPKRKKMPMSVVKTATIHQASLEMRQPHFADCPNASDFRKK